jgi:hypothetical protein
MSDKLLSRILACFFDASERYGLDNKKVNKVIREVQHFFSKDSKRNDRRCFVCEEE